MSESFDLDAVELPVMRVQFAGKEHVVYPVEFLAAVARDCPPEAPMSVFVDAVRKASGMATLDGDRAAALYDRAVEFVTVMREAKKKAVRPAASPGSTASRRKKSRR